MKGSGAGGATLLMILSTTTQSPNVLLVKGNITTPTLVPNITTRTPVPNITTPTPVPRACEGDAGLAFSNSQADAHSRLTEYLEPNKYLTSTTNGVILCTFALAMWVLAIIHDVSDTISLLHALLVLPRGPKTELRTDEDGAIHIECMSLVRLIWVVLVMMCRIVIAFFLFSAGTLFLVSYTPSD